jgi:hypothetical protein
MAADYRSDKMDSIEGSGRARAEWLAFAQSFPRRTAPVIEHMPQIRLFPQGKSSAGQAGQKPSETKVVDAKEECELLGFWLMWHLAGGFRRLEEWGWHRATIHRKIRRFRDAFNGVHPDDAKFEWVTLDPARQWIITGEVYLDILDEMDEADFLAANYPDEK